MPDYHPTPFCFASAIFGSFRTAILIPMHVPRWSAGADSSAVCSAQFKFKEELPPMIIGDRLRAIREQKKLSQGDIERRCGLLRCYLSRVENGHTIPSIETLEKMARALEVPLYQLFYDGEEPPQLPNLPNRKTETDLLWGGSGRDARLLTKLRRSLGRMAESNRSLLLHMAQKMARKRRA
jgi:transcriptional regulator with XRE-family HTH domain